MNTLIQKLAKYLSLSRLCGLERGIHVTANGPHDGADRDADANLSAVLGREARDLWMGRGGEERTQSEAITFGFGLNLLTIYSSWENRIMRGERGGGCYKKRLGLHPCGFLSHVRARCCPPPPPCSCCEKGTRVEEKGWPDFFVVDDSHGPANLAYCIQPICCLLRPWPAIFRLVNLYVRYKFVPLCFSVFYPASSVAY